MILKVLPALAAATALLAVETKTWTQSDAAEFEKGTLKGLALRSDGKLTLAPLFREIHDPAVPHIWALATGANGAIYAGGAEGKIFAIPNSGAPRLLATLEGGSVYAMVAGRNNELYAAVSPDARIYRISADGNATLFHTSKAKYIWALAVDGDQLVAATGEPGQIHRIDSKGQASLLYDTGEAHVRSLARGRQDVLYAGTEPGGLVLRVTAQGQGFVVHQTGRREVTALALQSDGSLWAAAAGRKTALPAPIIPPPTTTPAPATAPSGAAAGSAQQTQTTIRPIAAAPPTLGPSAASLAGGSEIWHIMPDGEPRLRWTEAQEIVYALAVGRDGKPVAATGNQGYLFRLDSEVLSTRLADAEPSQLTALAVMADGSIAVAAANPGRVYRLGPGLEREGTAESDLLDAQSFTYWGRLRYEGELNGGEIQFETRSGNLDRAEQHWSPWAPVTDRVSSPAARFLGWRATLKASPGGKSPELSLVEVAYQDKNVAPSVDSIEVTPANYRFPASSSLISSSSSTLTLPPIGQKRRSTPSSASSQPSGNVTMNYAKGWIGARWKSSDANGDTTHFKLEIRGVEEREWKLLKDEVEENRYSWDATAFADGTYVLRVTATDQPDNYPGQGLTAQAESVPFLIDQTPPAVEGLSARVEGSKIAIRFRGVDVHSALSSAEYSLNGGAWVAAQPTTRITDSRSHDYAVEIDRPAGPAEFTIAVRVTDDHDNVAVHKTVLR